MRISLMVAAVALVAVIFVFFPREEEEPEATAQWFKGNTHTHSLWSDGNDFPEMIAAFYKNNDYDFLVLSDHNLLSRGDKWMSVREVEKRRRLPRHSTLEKYLAAFGDSWVELRGEGETREVRLKTLAEIRPRFEEPGEFLFIEGEEISDSHAGKPVHLNAINLDEVIKPQGGGSIRETMRNNLLAVQEQEERLQRPILAHLNHPNFRWSVSAEDLAHVVEEDFFEVYNGHPVINHLGDDDRAGDEKIWDIANTIRLAELGASPLFGVATDDSHTYHGGEVKPGRGWVMVRAETLSAGALIEAMREGDFYASTGVTLTSLERDQEAGEFRFEIEAVDGVTFTTQIIGTRRGNEDDPAQVGEVLETVEGTEVSFALSGDLLYARATITSSEPHERPSFKGQRKQAWTQPVWREPEGAVARK